MTDKKIKGVILYIEEKSGTKNGKEWKLFNVAIGDIKITTFNEILIEGFEEGNEVYIEYTEKVNGAFTNRTMNVIKDLKQYEETEKIAKKYTLKDLATEKVSTPVIEEIEEEIFVMIGEKKYKINCERVQ